MKFHRAVLTTVTLTAVLYLAGQRTATADQHHTNGSRRAMPRPSGPSSTASGRSGCCGREDLRASSRYLDLLTDDALVVSGGPNRLSKPSMKMFDQAVDDNHPFENKRIAYELYPQGLVIHGNVAIAHYICAVRVIDKDNKVESSQCRSTDVLVRDRPGAEWKLITWVTGPFRGRPRQRSHA